MSVMFYQIKTHLHLKLILVFSLVMLLPTLAIAFYTLNRSETVLISHISAAQLQLATARAATVESQITKAGTDLLFVLQSAALHRYSNSEPGAKAKLNASFQSFLEGSPGRYSAICMLNMRGQEQVCVRARAKGNYAAVPTSGLQSRLASPAFIGALQQPGILSASPLAITGGDLLLTGSPLIAYSLAYRDEKGSPIGVLVLEAPVDNLLAELTDPEPGVSMTVFSSSGDYIFSSDHAQPAQGAGAQSLSQALPNTAQSILREPAGVRLDPPDRPGRLLVFTRIYPTSQSAVYWTVIYERSVEESMAIVRETRTVIIGLTVLAMGIALALAWLLANRIVRPIRALAHAAERVGTGDLRAPIPVVGQDEIGALGRTFAQTVARLCASLAAAEQRNSEAETLAAASRALGATLDRDQVLDLILSELGRVVPFDSASVQEVRDDTAIIIACYSLKDSELIMGSRFALTNGATVNAEVARTRAPLILDDAPAHYDTFRKAPFNNNPIKSWLGVPMIFGEQLVGIISLDKHEPGYYQAEHARLALAFATQAAAAMENARLYTTARRELAERQRAEAAYACLAAIIEATTDLVGMANMEGQLLFLNQAARRTLAFDDKQVLEQLQVADLFPPRLLPWLRKEAVPSAIREGTWSGETVLLTRAGNEIPVSQVIICHYGADGHPELLSTIVRDMRERQREEEELRQAQNMEALGRLAGGLAHDFNNLLTVILGEVDLLLLDLPSDSPLLTSVEQIRSSGTRAAALTSQLLAFSRRQVLQTELLSLNTVIGEIEHMLRRLLGEHILLNISLDPQLPLVQANRGQMQQVVMNLAINARDAMPGGGILTITTAGLALKGTTETLHPGITPGSYALLRVSDTGAGIDNQHRDHIFEPFFTTKDRGKGTGLGLATVHGIVRQSGGQINFESSPGCGTVFRIYLPAGAEANRDDHTSTTPNHIKRQTSGKLSGTVLLAEDDDDVRALAGQILTRHGFTVLTASDGQAALALARAYHGPIQVLLTDVVMPGGLNGVELAAALSANRPQLRVLYMSGYTDNALSEHSLGKHGTGYLQKPFTPEALTSALLAVLA